MRKQTSRKKNVKKLGPHIGKNHQAVIPDLIGVRDRQMINDVPVPDQIEWKTIEKKSFLLGLYLFGKDLELVKRFVGTEKKMGDLLRLYYGNFYASIEYDKWAEFRKKSKGENVLSGWRHEKFSTRLFTLTSDDFQDILFETSVNFANKSLRFVDYVFLLREKVGVKVLVKAVGIGRSKSDLSEVPSRKPRENDPEPLDKKLDSYASLDPSQIIEELRAEAELRKGFFWRAVWPRLVSRGWRCERVEGKTVFIVDGAKKFSRRLAKGRQYFESVQEVVKTVAEQPRLLGHRERRLRNGVTSKKVKAKEAFTVVDTSRLTENETLIELRNLPAGSNVTSSVKISGGDETLIELQNLPAGNAVASPINSGDQTLAELRDSLMGSRVASPVKISGRGETLIEIPSLLAGTVVASPVKANGGDETLVELQNFPAGNAVASPVKINGGDVHLIELQNYPAENYVASPVKVNDGDDTLIELQNFPAGTAVASPIKVNSGDETLTELPKLPAGSAVASPAKIDGRDESVITPRNCVVEIKSADASEAVDVDGQPSKKMEKFALDFDLNVAVNWEEEGDTSSGMGAKKVLIDLNVAYVPMDWELAELDSSAMQTAEKSMVADRAKNTGTRKSVRKRKITKRAIEALVPSKKRKQLSSFQECISS